MPLPLKISNLVKKIYFDLITRQLKISVAILAYLMVWYTLLRLGFLIANYRFFAGVSGKEIFMAFIYGWRFDIAALLMINGPLLLLYNFPLGLARWKWFRIGLGILFWSINIFFIALNLAEYGNFPVSQRRLMTELYTSLTEILTVMPSTLIDYFYLWLILAAGAAFFVSTSRYLFRKLEQKIDYQPGFGSTPLESPLIKPKMTVMVLLRLLGNFLLRTLSPQDERVTGRKLGCFLIVMVLMVPGIKGGIQRKPIRQAHAFWSKNRIIGYLTLNSSFTVVKSLSQASLKPPRLLPPEQAVAEVKEMLCQSNEEMIDSEYPFLRRKSFADNPCRLNIVIFIMESWTADYIGCVSGQQPSSTSFFDSLALSGTLFTNFLATGHRSVIAIPSIIDSIPGFYTDSGIGKENSFIESQSEVNNYIGLGNILGRLGYTTSCHHGAHVGALGFDSHSRLSGFKHYYGLEDYLKAGGSAKDSVWGVWDEEFFLDMMNRIDGFQPPFCSVVFSLTSHEPFRIPPHRQALFDQYTNENKFQKVLRYSDYSLQQFFAAARTKPWFKNTIFIITADHTSHSGINNFYSCFRIPLLIYGPDLIKPRRCEVIGSQVDILPTILDLLQISTIHASMGCSLLDTSKPHYAVVNDGTLYAIFSEQYVLLNDLEKNVGLYDYRTDPLFKNDLLLKHPAETERLKRLLYGYIQEVSGAIARNRICRESDIK